MTNLKSKLLSAKKRQPVTVEIFGDEYQIMRLSAARISEHDKAMKEFADSTDESMANACKLILESIIDEEGKPAKETTSIEDLEQVYGNAEIIEAMKTIITANFNLESAKNV